MTKNTNIQRLKAVPKKRVAVITKSGATHTSKWTEIDEIYKNYDSIDNWEKNVVQNIENNFNEGDFVQSVFLQDYKCGDGFYVTEHALKRVKERTGWNRRAALRMIKKAYENGEKHLPKEHYLCTWVASKAARENAEQNNYVLYGEYLFIFKKKTLITVLRVPSKEKIKHIKRKNTGYKKSKEELKYV